MYTYHRKKGGYMVKVGSIGTITNFKINNYPWHYIPGILNGDIQGILLDIKAYNNVIIVDFSNFFSDEYVQTKLTNNTKILGYVFIEDADGVAQKIEFNLLKEATLADWDSKHFSKFVIPNGDTVSITKVSLYYAIHNKNKANSTIWSYSRIYNATSNNIASSESWAETYYPIYYNVQYRDGNVNPSKETQGLRIANITGYAQFVVHTWNLDTTLTTSSKNVEKGVYYTRANLYPTE